MAITLQNQKEVFNMLMKGEIRKNGVQGPNTPFANYIRGLNYESIADSVFAGTISEDILVNITAVCRRCFKKQDVILFVDLDTDEEYEAGIVFTEKGIFSWTDSGMEIEEISYESITQVDFDDEDIIITHEGETTYINMGEDAEEEKYPRYMYNFIMDILEFDSQDVAGEQNANFEMPEQELTDIIL